MRGTTYWPLYSHGRCIVTPLHAPALRTARLPATIHDMFGGCLRRVGCVVLVVIVAAAGWYWYTTMRGGAATPAGAERSVWEPVTPDGAARGRAALEALGRPGGPGFVAVSAGDVASYVFYSASNRLPESTHDLQAAVIEDQLAVRGVIPLRDLGVGRVLGPLASVLGEADTVFFAGRLSVVQPEVGQYRVSELRLQQFRVPPGIIPRVLRGIDRNERPPGVSPDALALPLPPHVGDISIGGGVVILYRHAR
jgi:hypothetical protein